MVKSFLARGLRYFIFTLVAIYTYISAGFVDYWSRIKVLNIKIFNLIKFCVLAVTKKRVGRLEIERILYSSERSLKAMKRKGDRRIKSLSHFEDNSEISTW